MAQRRPPFDFDLNELLPPEDDGASDASPGLSPEPVCVPSQRDPLPPPAARQSSAHDLPAAPVPESSPQDSLLASASAPQSSAYDLPLTPMPESSAHDPLPATASAPQSTAHDLPPASVAESSPQNDLPAPAVSASLPLDLPPATVPDKSHDPLLAPVPESIPHGSLPPPTPTPTPTPESSPSPMLDLEGPLSSLDDDDDYYDEADLPPPPAGPPPFGLAVAAAPERSSSNEADLPPPPPGPPPFVLAVVAAAPARSSSSVDTPRALPVHPIRRRERTSRARASQEPFGLSSPEKSALRGPYSQRWRRNPYTYNEPRGDMIPKQRRADFDDDAGSSQSGSRRSELASPPQFEQGGWRRAPATHGQPGAPPRNRRRRRPQKAQHGYQQYQGPVEKHHGRGREQQQQQGFRGQERPQVHEGYRGPHGPVVTKAGYSSSGSFVKSGSSDFRYSPEREPINGAPPSREYSRPYGREDSDQRQRQAQERGYQQREAPSLRPSSGAHGRDGSSGGWRQTPAQQPIDGGGAYQQRKAPRGRERFPDRSYHPYARDGGASYRNNGGQLSYEPRRRDSKQQRTPGEHARGPQYYGD